jgi:transcriptional regulator with XRE-family HTH domain
MLNSRGMLANGPAIRGLRRAQGHSQTSFANAVGCDEKTVRNAEAGNRIQADTLQRFAVVLAVDVSAIMIASGNNKEDLEGRLVAIRDWRAAFDRRAVDEIMQTYATDATVRLRGLGVDQGSLDVSGNEAIGMLFCSLFNQFRFAKWPELRTRLDVSNEFVFLRSELSIVRVQDEQSFTMTTFHEFEFDGTLVCHHTGVFTIS